MFTSFNRQARGGCVTFGVMKRVLFYSAVIVLSMFYVCRNMGGGVARSGAGVIQVRLILDRSQTDATPPNSVEYQPFRVAPCRACARRICVLLLNDVDFEISRIP